MTKFHDNLSKWLSLHPDEEKLAAGLETLSSPSSAKLCSTTSGLPNIQLNFPGENKSAIYLHAEDNPEKEAAEWFKTLDMVHVQTLFVYGIGLGYYYDAALKWLNEDPKRHLVFIEDNAEVMRLFLETERCTEMLENRQVFIYLLGARQEQVHQFNKLTELFSSTEFLYTGLNSYAKARSDFYHEFKSTVTFLMLMNEMMHSESVTHGVTFFRNYFLNLLDLPDSYLANGLKGKFEGIPAIICGAGPSLDKNIDVLASLGDRALIFAGGTALNALNGKGVMPHFGVGIDPNPDQFTRLIMNNGFELPFLYRCRMLHEALEMVHGEKLYLTGSGGYDIAKWYEKQLGIDEPELQEGFNVLNFSVMIAHAMGCNPIICVGIDLAYSEGNSYGAGVSSHPIHSRKHNFRTKMIEDELIIKSDIHGRPVNTLWKWIAESMWYHNFAASHPQCTLINATEGGIGFPSIKNMTLAEVKEQFLNKALDLKTNIHGEIQNSPLPSTFNDERIVSLSKLLLENLIKCGEQCLRIAGMLAKEKRQSESITEEMDRLAKEIAYDAILKRFDESYIKRHSLDIKRLEMEKPSLSDEEYAQKKAAIDQERYLSLAETCQIDGILIQDILDKHAKFNEKMAAEAQEKDNNAKKLKQEYVVPEPSKEDSYVFNEQKFRIKDTELEIDYNEDFSTGTLQKKEMSYPSGKIKWEKYYLNDAFHGPSSFFGEEGTLLSRVWYVHGKQTGKLWTYYADGSLHSLQRFDHGLPVGIHQYFYPNGLPKSILSYKSGVLDGEIHLFNPHGMLFRRLSFVNGKRTGQERIWDPTGQLIIECQYEADRPVGLSRMWHRNGVLAKEFLYDKDSRRVEAKEWTVDGLVIDLDNNRNEDYFDLVNKETEKLTQSLSEMVNKMTEITPLISDKFHFDAKVPFSKEEASKQSLQYDLADEMANLQKELEKLQSLDALIKIQLGQDDEAKEAIWKTPSSRREMEKRFEGVREKINDGLSDIQKGIKTVVKSLIDEKPKAD